MTQLSVNLLGPLEVRLAGRLVPAPGGDVRTLLVMCLLDEERTLRREVALTELWGETAPASGPANLRNYLTSLRALVAGLGGELSRSPSGWSLRLDCVIDAYRFRAAIENAYTARSCGDRLAALELFGEAMSLYRSSPLADVAQGPVLLVHSQVIAVQWQSALEEYAALLVELGKFDQARYLLYGFLRCQPYRERAWGQLMLACSSSGDVAGAVAAFDQARASLAEGLSAEPSAMLKSLRSAILRGESTVRMRPYIPA